jgi:hypothetical protein
MNLQATSDRVFESGRQSIGIVHWWPASSALRAESLFSCGLALSVTVGDSMRRRLSTFGADSIRVPPMSIEWLQTHEAEYTKHPGEP